MSVKCRAPALLRPHHPKRLEHFAHLVHELVARFTESRNGVHQILEAKHQSRDPWLARAKVCV